MNLIELHILQSFPVTCLNRDDVGAPKSALFGGSQRARVSSQCWKRAIRLQAKELAPERFAGQRTRFLVRELKKAFHEAGQEDVRAGLLATAAADAIGKLDSVEKGNVKTLLFFSPDELKGVVEAMLECDFGDDLALVYDEAAAKAARDKAVKKVQDIARKAVKAFGGKVKDAADIAVFGRMVADDHSLMIEGAGLFSHAISTHSTANEIDFFSAVDDKNTDGDEGAGHIGTLEFNSACYYRYVGLNLDLLDDAEHLAHLAEDEQRQVVDAFLRAAILAVPAARKNSMFGHNPPAYVLGLRRTGQPLSLVNAFESPVRSSHGYVEASIAALDGHWHKLAETYCLQSQVQSAARIPEMNLDQFIARLTGDDQHE